VNYPLQLWDIEASRTTGEPSLLWTVNDDWFDYEAASEKHFPDYARVRWSLDGQEIITVSNDISVFRMFHSVERWSVVDGSSLGRLYFSEARTRPPTAEPSPDLRLLAQTNTFWPTNERDKPHPVEILRSDTLQPLLSFESANADTVTWSPNGNLLAANGFGKGKTEIWDVSQNPARLLMTIEVANDYDNGTWNADGTLFAIGNQIFDPVSGTQVGQLEFDTSRSYSRVWSPDNRVFAVYGYQRPEISFYNVATGNLIQVEAVPSRYVTALAYSPDGTMLAVGLDDGTIRIWDVSDLG
jgi:WD40 repeat protein